MNTNNNYSSRDRLAAENQLGNRKNSFGLFKDLFNNDRYRYNFNKTFQLSPIGYYRLAFHAGLNCRFYLWSNKM